MEEEHRWRETFDGHVREIACPVVVGQPMSFEGHVGPEDTPVMATWQGADLPPELCKKGVFDTGATHTVLATGVAQSVGLQPLRRETMRTAGGSIQSWLYYASIWLPNRIVYPFVTVTEGDLPPGDEVLIGMDIIGQSMLHIQYRPREDKTLFFFSPPE